MQRHLALEEAQRRFLAATGHKATVGALTSETLRAFVAWL